MSLRLVFAACIITLISLTRAQDETTVPEATIPLTTVPETETTAPRTTAPRTTAPRTTAPETTAPGTTAPETTCATERDLTALEARVDMLLSNRLRAVEAALAELLARTETTTTTVRLPATTIPTQGANNGNGPDATIAATTVVGGTDATSAPGPYQFMATPVKWTDARDYCRSLGGDLPSIHSADEEKQLRAAVPDLTVAYWVGINDEDDDGNIAWSDGSALNDYTLAWGFNHPQKGECGVLTSNDGSWWDVPCLSTYPFVCQI